jgi:1-acyl-sn-glycerol-3-phosphate acyltransferase
VSVAQKSDEPQVGEFPETFTEVQGGTLRLWWRTAWLVALTIPVISAISLGVFLSFLYAPLAVWVRRTFMKLWCRLAFWIIGAKVEVCGPNPEMPCLLVANHLSYLDIFLIGHALGNVNVSREDVQSWPIFGFLATVQGTIYINRSSPRDTQRVNERIRHAYDEGYGITFFPEARIGPGKDVARFNSSLLQPAASEDIPVHYAALHYATLPGYPPASEVIVWPRGVSFVGHMKRVLRMPGFRARITFGEEPMCSDDRKELAEQLWVAVRERFEPVD